MSAPGTIRTRDLAGRNGSLYPLSYGGDSDTLAASDARYALSDLPANVLSKISTDCWSWTGATNSKGYPCIGVNGVSQLAHRRVYELAGGTIPEGWQVDHLCRNIRCVRPDHLEAVEPRENVARRSRAYNECRRGHRVEGDNVRLHRRGNGVVTRECRACALEVQRRSNAKRAVKSPAA